MLNFDAKSYTSSEYIQHLRYQLEDMLIRAALDSTNGNLSGAVTLAAELLTSMRNVTDDYTGNNLRKTNQDEYDYQNPKKVAPPFPSDYLSSKTPTANDRVSPREELQDIFKHLSEDRG